MLYKGHNVEVVVDVLNGRKLPLNDLAVYRRSNHLRIIKSARREDPYQSLRYVDPKSLWDFPGHETIRSDWYRHLLLYDGGEYELVLDALAVADSKMGRTPETILFGGEVVIAANKPLWVGESGMVWLPNFDSNTHEAVVEWESVVELKSRKISNAKIH